MARVDQAHLVLEHEARVRLCQTHQSLEHADRRARSIAVSRGAHARVVRLQHALRGLAERGQPCGLDVLNVLAQLVKRPRLLPAARR